jgi:hypothetical protein
MKKIASLSCFEIYIIFFEKMEKGEKEIEK